ncbi:MAG: phosphotransferase family protein [Pseudonocardiaceae bacterium]
MDLPDYTLADLLRFYGLSRSGWEVLHHSGRSGAKIFRLIDAQKRPWILKKTSIDRDWIMRATADAHGREQAVARAWALRENGVRSAAVGGVREGVNCYTLMQDVSHYLIRRRRITADEFDAVIDGMAALHAVAPRHALIVPWCPVERRLSLLSQKGIRIPRGYGKVSLARDLSHGWSLFFHQAPRRVVETIMSIVKDFRILERALAKLPSQLLHGDLKFDNIGLDSSRHMWLIDWAMLMYAPSAIELGWFMAINSKQIDISLDDVVALYCDRATIGSAIRPRYQALSAICGLLLRGWRKALDADGGEASEMRWWCEQVIEAQRFL